MYYRMCLLVSRNARQGAASLARPGDGTKQRVSRSLRIPTTTINPAGSSKDVHHIQLIMNYIALAQIKRAMD